MGDCGYDSHPDRMELSCRGIPTAIACRNTPHGGGLGFFRYVEEQTIALLHQFRRLRTPFVKGQLTITANPERASILRLG